MGWPYWTKAGRLGNACKRKHTHEVQREISLFRRTSGKQTFLKTEHTEAMKLQGGGGGEEKKS
jgi:hypothetical protein